VGQVRRVRQTGRAGQPGQVLLAAFAIVVIASLAYASSFTGVLVFDDEPAIAANPHIHHLWPLTEAMSAPRDTTLSGRPVASLSFAINDALTPDLWGYHAGNLFIHLLAALVLFGIVRRTLRTPRMRERFGGAADVLALCIALLWAVHPLQTGSITYVVQRAESLMGLFYLLTLYCAIRTRADDDRSTFVVRRSSFVWAAGAVTACALGMATKESMATAPLMVIAWDFLFAQDEVARRRGLYAGLASTWVILAALVAGGHRAHAVGFSFPAWPWWTYLITQTQVIVHYLRLAIVPWPLVLDYAWPPARSIASAAPQLFIIAALAAASVWAFIRRLPLGFAGIWFFGILAPTSSVVPIVTEVAAEHRMYLPLAAVVSVVVLAAFAAAPKAVRGALVVALSAMIALAAIGTDARNRDYRSLEGIWLDTVQKRPANPRARANYASALILRGEYAAAESHLRIAVAAQPDLAEAQADLGVALAARDAFDEGIAHLQRAIAIQPDYVAAHRNLGEAYAASGQFGAAARAFEKALELDPDDVFALKRRSWILATARDEGVRDGAQAVALAARAVRLTGRRDADALDTLAAAYAEVGRFDAAIETGEEALARAQQSSDRAKIAELEERLALYRAGQKIRE
jgi:protein O-mannosyl-transferase